MTDSRTRPQRKSAAIALIEEGKVRLLWTGADCVWVGGLLSDIGAGINRYPTGLSSKGRVAGFSLAIPNQAFTFYNGGITNLPVPAGFPKDSQALAVNRCGVLVGTATTSTFLTHGMIWTPSFCD